MTLPYSNKTWGELIVTSLWAVHGLTGNWITTTSGEPSVNLQISGTYLCWQIYVIKILQYSYNQLSFLNFYQAISKQVPQSLDFRAKGLCCF